MKLEIIREKLVEGGWYPGRMFGKDLHVCFNPVCVYRKYKNEKNCHYNIYVAIRDDNSFVLTPSLTFEHLINVNDIKEINADEKEIKINCFDGSVGSIQFQDDETFVFTRKKLHEETPPPMSLEDVGCFYFYVWSRNLSSASSMGSQKKYESIEDIWSMLQGQSEEEQSTKEYLISMYRKETAEDIKRRDEEFKKWGYGDVNRCSKKDDEEYVNPYKSGLEPF